jgi:sugar (pentulose or hexulose) kinase
MGDRAFIALDLGTAFIKGAVVHLDRPGLAHIRRVPFPEPIAGLPALFCEIDPARIIAAVRHVIDELAACTPACSGLVMCGQMGGLVLTTAAGAALTNYISWRDQRLLQPHPSGAGTYFEVLRQALSPDERRQLGNEVRPGLPLSFLFWLAETQRLPAPAPIAATLTDFVLAHLCGTRPALEMTQATGALNLETGDWHWSVFDKLGLAGVGWPTLQGLHTPVGYLAAGGQRLPCYAPVGDHQCALAGASLEEHELSLNISTGSQASLLTRQLAPGNFQTRPYFDGQFLNTITHIPAGRALNVLVALLTELPVAQAAPLEEPWPYIQAEAARVSDTDLAVDLSFFPSPVGERGAITNIREDNLSVGQLFRAAFRSMADNYETCALRLSPARAWRSMVYSGGLAQKLDLLRNMIEARLPGPSRLCATTEDTLAGLLALAWVVSGQASTIQAATQRLRQHAPALA